MKSLVESLFDIEKNITKELTFGEMFKLMDIETKDTLSRPGHGRTGGMMVKMKSKPEDMYKISLISKDSGQKVTKDLQSIANALATIVKKIPMTADSIKLSLYDFSQIILKPLKQYYSSAVGNGYLSMVTRDVSLMDVKEVDVDFLNIKLHYSRR